MADPDRPFDTLIDPKVLFARRDDDWCVIDCRAALTDLEFGAAAYRAGHIPGAVFADLAADLSGPVVPGKTGRHPLPDPAILADTFGRWGIDAGTQVVAYDAGNGAFAARAWWLLRWLGHARVAVLDGGLAAWQADGFPLVAGVEHRAAAEFPIRAALTRTVSVGDLVERGAEYDLIDARALPRYQGEVEPIDPVAGHIPGARCVPFEGNVDERARFIERAALAARFVPPDDSTKAQVCYCGSGVTACHDILAMVHAGLPEPALYPGSFSEWITDPARRVER
jgi:thiosulfate/3-mercaptopyruvate sulfurtransferase